MPHGTHMPSYNERERESESVFIYLGLLNWKYCLKYILHAWQHHCWSFTVCLGSPFKCKLAFWLLWYAPKPSQAKTTVKNSDQTLFRFMRLDKLWLHLMCAYGVTCPFHVTPQTRAKKLHQLHPSSLHSLLSLSLSRLLIYSDSISISVDMSSGFVGLAVAVDVFCTLDKNSVYSFCSLLPDSVEFLVVAKSFWWNGLVALWSSFVISFTSRAEPSWLDPT